MITCPRPLVLALTGCSLTVGIGISVYATSVFAQEERADAALNQLVHEPPTMEDLESADIHPELKKVIRYGHDLFTNTQQLRGENVFNDMNCSSCHLGEGRVPFSAPVWTAAITLPDFRGKNQHVNSLEERIAGCFAYSMNGVPPEYGSDEMLALSAYHQWLATGAPMYPDKPIYGRGFPAPEEPTEEGKLPTRKTARYATRKMVPGTMRMMSTCFPRPGVTAPITGEPASRGWKPWRASSIRTCRLASLVRSVINRPGILPII